MKMMMLETAVSPSLRHAQVLRTTTRMGMAAPLGWRPAAETPKAAPRSRLYAPAKRKARSIWIAPDAMPLGEKLMMGALALCGVGAIGYGLAWVVDLVGHWALFQTAVARMIQ
jgi:hypothetical protein